MLCDHTPHAPFSETGGSAKVCGGFDFFRCRNLRALSIAEDGRKGAAAEESPLPKPPELALYTSWLTSEAVDLLEPRRDSEPFRELFRDRLPVACLRSEASWLSVIIDGDDSGGGALFFILARARTGKTVARSDGAKRRGPGAELRLFLLRISPMVPARFLESHLPMAPSR